MARAALGLQSALAMPVGSGKVNLFATASDGSMAAVARVQARIRESLGVFGEGRIGMTRDDSQRWRRDWAVLGGVEYKW
jgi:hypothetical protein